MSDANLADSPADFVRQLLRTDIKPRQLIYTAVRLEVCEALGSTSATSAAVATQLGLDPDALHRVLRGMVALGLADQMEPDRYVLTAAGQLLRRKVPGTVRGEVLLAGERDRAWCALADTLQTGQPGYEIAHGAGLFAKVAADPDRGDAFHRWMAEGSDDLHAIATLCPLPLQGTVVDVGGGRGDFLAVVLEQRPLLCGVLFDLAVAVEESPNIAERAGINDRWTVRIGDFFTDVLPDGDVYVLQRILHDWSDKDAGRILDRCRAGMSSTSTLLVIEKLLPEHVVDDPGVTFLDLDMLVEIGGRQRSEEQFSELFARHGLQLEQVIPGSGGPSILVASSQSPSR